jgi:hypothetical protein
MKAVVEAVAVGRVLLSTMKNSENELKEVTGYGYSRALVDAPVAATHSTGLATAT